MNLSLQNHSTSGARQPAYLRLDEVVALRPDMLQEAQDVHCAFVFDLLQHAVYHYVGARPAHAGAGREEDTR